MFLSLPSVLRAAARRATVLLLAAVTFAGAPGLQAQTAHFLASEATVANGTNAAGVPIQAVRDAAGNTYDLTASGAVYKLAPGCLDYSACGGTAIIAAAAGNVDLAVDTTGAVYVANSTAKTVTKYTLASGAYTGAVVITTGQGTDTASAPAALDVDASGTIYLAQNGSTSTGTNIFTYAPACHSDSAAANCAGAILVGGHSNAAPFTAVRLFGTDRLAYASALLSMGEITVITGFTTGNLNGTGRVPGTVPGSFRSLSLDAAGNLYAGYAATAGAGYLTQFPSTCARASCSTFNLTGVTTPGAIVSDGVAGVTVYDALATSNRIVDYSQLPSNFGPVLVGAASTASSTIFGFNTAGTLGAVQVVEQGNVDPDYTAVTGTGTTCIQGTAYVQGSICTVQSQFAPTAKIGVLNGAVLLNNSSAAQIASGLLTGTASAARPAFAFGATVGVVALSSSPQAVAVDSEGNLVAADNNNQLNRYTLAGGTYTGTTVGANGLDNFDNIAIDSTGLIYFTDGGHGKVVRVERDGSFTTLPITANYPYGIAVDSDSSLYLTDGQRFLKETPRTDGTYAETLLYTGPSIAYGYYALAVDSSHNLYYTDYARGQIVKLTLAGGTYTSAVIGTYQLPNHLVVDASGSVFNTGMYAGVKRLSPNGDGTYTATQIVPASNSGGAGLGVDALGNVFFTQSGNAELYRVNPATPPALAFASTVAGSTSAAQAVTVLNNGNAPLTFPIPSSGNNPGISGRFAFATGSNCGPSGGVATALAPGALCTEQVTFVPTQTGPTTGSVAFTDNALNAAPATQVVNLSGTGLAQPQTITFTPPASPAIVGSTVTLSATADSGLPVTIAVSGPATLNGSTLTYTGPGQVNLEADQAGNATYAAASPVHATVLAQEVPSSYTAATVAVGTSNTITVSLNFPANATLNGTLASAIQVTTKGAPNLDFTYAAGGTCTPGASYTTVQSCTVQVTFTPTAPGLRLGGVSLYDANGVLVAQSFISGVGTAPQALFTIGNQTAANTTGAGYLRGASVDGAGNSYAEGDNGLYKVTPAGIASQVLPLTSGHADATAVDGAGNVYYVGFATGSTTNQEIYELVGGTGTPVAIAPLTNPDNTFAVDPAGNVYYSQGSSIHKIAVGTGADTVYVPAQSGRRLISIAFDAAGNLFAADYTNTQIVKFAAGTGTVTTLDADAYQPQGLALDAAGDFYANSESSAFRVQPDGSNGTNLGQPACCGIAIRPDGALFAVGDNDAVTITDRVHPAPLDFGNVEEQTATSATTFSFENDGNATLTIASIVASANYKIDNGTTTCGSTLAAGAQCVIGVVFTAPATTGTYTGTVTITDNSGNATAATQVQNLTAVSVAPAFSSYAYTVTTNPVVAGSPATIHLQAVDQSGQPFNAYNGMANVSPNGAGAGTFPATAVFTNGVANYTFTPQSTNTSGINVNDAATGLGVTVPVTVNAGPAVSLQVSASGAAPRTGGSFFVYITGLDQYGNYGASAVVTQTVVPGGNGAGATPALNLVTSPVTSFLTANATAGTFTINFNAPGVAQRTLLITTTQPDVFLVTVNSDTNNDSQTLCVNQTAGGYNTGNTTNNAACSLRGAVDAANNTTNAVIRFAPNVGSTATPGIITLASNNLGLNEPVTITGPGSAALTISGTNTNGDIFDFNSDDVTVLSGLRLANAPYEAVYNDGGSINLTDVIVTGAGENDLYGTAVVSNSSFLNTANNNEALYIGDQGTLSNMLFQGNSGNSIVFGGTGLSTLTNSAFVNNADAGTFYGGAIVAAGITLNASNVTMSGNSGVGAVAVNLQGGANVTFANSTFTGNAASGAGILTNTDSGTLTLRNSTVANNTVGTGTAQVVGPAILVNSIVADVNNTPASIGNCPNCTQTGANVVDVDPKLAPLANYGAAVTPQVPVLQTLLPLPGSPAICAGAAATDTTDERGFPRPTNTVTTSCYDIGAVQTAYALGFTTQPGTTTVFNNITPAPAVTLTEHGNGIAGVAFTVTDSKGAGTLTGTTTTTTNGTGVASFATLAPQQGGSQTLTAGAGTLTATSNAFTVTPATPTVMLAVNPTTQVYGTPVAAGTFTGTATYNGTTVPGTYTYTATLATGSAVTVAQGTTLLPAAAYKVVANFTPTNTQTYQAASSITSVTNYTVTPATAAITFAVPNHAYGDAPFTVNASSASTGAFTYTVVSGPATISGTTVTLTGAGTVVLQAAQAADTNYVANSKQASFAVSKTATTTVTIAPITTAMFGTATTVTVSIPAAGSTPAGGTLTYSFDGGAPTTAMVMNGSAMITVPGTLMGGSHTVSVTYAGDGNYGGGTTMQTFTVAPSATAPTVTFAPIPTHTYGDAPFTVSASSVSTGAITYTVVSGPATISGTTVTLTGAGTVVLKASQAATANYAAAMQQASFNTAAAGSNTVLVSSANPSLAGANVTFTATVSSAAGTPTGSVTFADGGTMLATVATTNGVATYSTTALSVATHTITATFGSANFATSTGSVMQAVNSSVAFTLTDGGAGSFALTVARGSVATTTITITPSAQFSGTVALTCTGLPVTGTCSFSSSSLTFAAGGGSQNTQVSIGTSVAYASTGDADRPLDRSSGLAPVLASIFWLPGLLLAGAGARSRKLGGHNRLMLAGLLLLSVAGMAGLTGCGSSSFNTTVTPGVYTVNVTATSGATTQTLPITVTVQ